MSYNISVRMKVKTSHSVSVVYIRVGLHDFVRFVLFVFGIWLEYCINVFCLAKLPLPSLLDREIHLLELSLSLLIDISSLVTSVPRLVYMR